MKKIIYLFFFLVFLNSCKIYRKITPEFSQIQEKQEIIIEDAFNTISAHKDTIFQMRCTGANTQPYIVDKKNDITLEVDGVSASLRNIDNNNFILSLDKKSEKITRNFKTQIPIKTNVVTEKNDKKKEISLIIRTLIVAFIAFCIYIINKRKY